MSPRAEVKAAHKAELPPLPKPRPKLSEPVAGQIGYDAASATTGAAAPEDKTRQAHRAGLGHARAHRRPERDQRRDEERDGARQRRRAPAARGPNAVLKIIEAGNAIARTPYKWGGGHGRFLDTGYDCSGSVSFALYAAGLIDGPSESGGLMSWGKAGPGKWVTLYSSPGHVYMEVAGIRFDTSGAKATGSRWQNDLRGQRAGFVARHPPGL